MKFYLLLFLCAAAFMPSPSFAQRVDPPEIIQSPYYDAIVLTYAFKGYKAYPVIVGTVLQQSAPVAGNPYGTQKSLNHYQVIESATGKIIGDTLVNEDTIPRRYMLKSRFRFKSTTEQQKLIYGVLARNAGMISSDSVPLAYKDNTYLMDELKAVAALKSAGGSRDVMLLLPDLHGVNTANALDNRGGSIPGVGVLAEGLAEFYIERVNEEVNDAFFIHLQSALKKSPELQLLFPKTLESLGKIEVTNYNMSLNAIKTAYEEDIRNLLPDIAKLATLKRYRNLIDRYPELTMLFVTCDLADLLHHNNAPADILYRIGKADYITKTKPSNYNAFIRMADLVSYCMRDIQVSDDNKNQAGWISAAKLNYLEANPEVYRIFMGLLAQRAGNIVILGDHESISLQAALYNNSHELLAERSLLYNFTKSAEDVQLKAARVAGLRSANKTSEYMAAYIGLSNALLGFSETCLDIIPSDSSVTARQEIRKIQASYVPIAYQANSVLEKTEAGAYSMAVYEADSLINRVLYKQVRAYTARKDSVRHAQQAALTTADPKNKSAAREINHKADSAAHVITNNTSLELDTISPIHKEFLHYGLFIAAVASAQSAADVKQAISAFSLPKGSSRIKKEHRFSVGLNSYVGFYHAWNTQYAGTKIPRMENGLTAPLGLGIHFGLSKFGSISLYGGIIDIGAIFTYKVANDSSSVQSDIRLSQIVSPSASLIYGFPIIKKYNIPLALGFSSQWGPRLKQVSAEGNSVLPMLTQHWNVFLGIDIPIVNFYTSKR